MDSVPGRHGWEEVLPKEGVAVSSPSPGVKMRSKGPVREDVQCLDAGKHTPSFTWKCSAAWCGSAGPESLPVPNSLGKPRLGSSGNGWTPVSRRAVSGGKRKDHIAGEVGVSIRKRKAGSKMSDSRGKKSSWIGEEQRKYCSSAPPTTGRGRIKVSFGRCFSRTWP